jgi:hypothetical protein
LFQAVGLISVWPAAAAQDCIVWTNFTEGKIPKQWLTLQAIHYQTTRSRRSSDQWAAGLVTTSCPAWFIHNGRIAVTSYMHKMHKDFDHRRQRTWIRQFPSNSSPALMGSTLETII